jgi:hypothetical protein
VLKVVDDEGGHRFACSKKRTLATVAFGSNSDIRAPAHRRASSATPWSCRAILRTSLRTSAAATWLRAR